MPVPRHCTFELNDVQPVGTYSKATSADDGTSNAESAQVETECAPVIADKDEKMLPAALESGLLVCEKQLEDSSSATTSMLECTKSMLADADEQVRMLSQDSAIGIHAANSPSFGAAGAVDGKPDVSSAVALCAIHPGPVTAESGPLLGNAQCPEIVPVVTDQQVQLCSLAESGPLLGTQCPEIVPVVTDQLKQVELCWLQKEAEEQVELCSLQVPVVTDQDMEQVQPVVTDQQKEADKEDIEAPAVVALPVNVATAEDVAPPNTKPLPKQGSDEFLKEPACANVSVSPGCPWMESVLEYCTDLRRSNAWIGPGALLLACLHYKMRMNLWHGETCTDLVAKFAPWAVETCIARSSLDAVLCAYSQDPDTGVRKLHPASGDVPMRALNHYVATIRMPGTVSSSLHGSTQLETFYLALGLCPIPTVIDGNCGLDVLVQTQGLPQTDTEFQRMRDRLSEHLLANRSDLRLIEALMAVGDIPRDNRLGDRGTVSEPLPVHDQGSGGVKSWPRKQVGKSRTPLCCEPIPTKKRKLCDGLAVYRIKTFVPLWLCWSSCLTGPLTFRLRVLKSISLPTHRNHSWCLRVFQKK